MQSTSASKQSTETLYEIKAPLASFDTIDLDDDDQYYVASLKQVNTVEKGLKETLKLTNLPVEIVESSIKQELEGSVKESEEKETPKEDTPAVQTPTEDTPTEEKPTKETPIVVKSTEVTPTEETPTEETPTEEVEDLNDSFVSTEAKEVENTGSTGSGESKDANSSENNASAEDIQNQLKVKGRKYREKASNVKYEQIENTSDISDQEKTESISPFPTLKLKPSSKVYDSDSESSDSDSGYIRRGYISATKGTPSNPDEPDGSLSQFVRAVIGNKDSYDSDFTPHSSPKVSRPMVPPPLSKEDSAIASKRKAYEKRLQRLQVTTTPIERPRSTTPIDIHGLEEYASISSPERSPGGSNLEKLKIRLPRQESFKGKSPRLCAKSAPNLCGSPVFSFNEDLLFTHTKSAILLEDGLPGQSPKRILVPPTLSPKLSPACSPQTRKLSSQSTRYIFHPETARNGSCIENKPKPDTASSTIAAENWATFDDVHAHSEPEENENDMKETKHDAGDTEKEILDMSGKVDDNMIKLLESPVHKTVPQDVDIVQRCEELNKDEVLTVQIEESGDTRLCDIKYEVDLK